MTVNGKALGIRGSEHCLFSDPLVEDIGDERSDSFIMKEFATGNRWIGKIFTGQIPGIALVATRKSLIHRDDLKPAIQRDNLFIKRINDDAQFVPALDKCVRQFVVTFLQVDHP